MWPTSFALKKLTAADEKKIGALVKKAVSSRPIWLLVPVVRFTRRRIPWKTPDVAALAW